MQKKRKPVFTISSIDDVCKTGFFGGKEVNPNYSQPSEIIKRLTKVKHLVIMGNGIKIDMEQITGIKERKSTQILS